MPNLFIVNLLRAMELIRPIVIKVKHYIIMNLVMIALEAVSKVVIELLFSRTHENGAYAWV